MTTLRTVTVTASPSTPATPATPRTVRRVLATVAILLVALAGAGAALLPAASAQQSVTGTADFRNAPHLPPGEYVDRIVTGDSAWYSVVYTNGTPYEFEVGIQGGNPGADVGVSVSFVAPTLTTVDGPNTLVSGTGVDYPAGHTNVWFLKVSVTTTGQAGVEYPVVIRTSGVQTFGTDPCSDTPGCTLDEEYAANNVALAEATAALEQMRSQETRAAVEAEIENARGFVDTGASLAPATQARLQRAEERIAELCAPEPDCDVFPPPGSKTPIIGWIVGLGVLGFGAYRAYRKFTLDPEAEAQKKQRARQSPGAKKKPTSSSSSSSGGSSSATKPQVRMGARLKGGR